MDYDVDLMRALMLMLEERQTSPRMTVVISLEDEAEALSHEVSDIGYCLNILLELEYIDGPGEDEPGFWLFRKLTRKGSKFVNEVRLLKDWVRLKQSYGHLDADPAR